MLQLGNYINYHGHLVKIKELYSHELQLELEDRTLLITGYSNIRFVELGSNVLLKLKDQQQTICRYIKSMDYDLHKKEDYEINLRGKKFYLHGFLYNDISIWQFFNVITVHYLHQLQNVIQILNPAVVLEIAE